MIKIKNLHLENFRCFENLTIDFSDKITCIAGFNGSGKSSLLLALNQCFSWMIEEITLKRKAVFISSENIFIGKNKSKISGVISMDGYSDILIDLESNKKTNQNYSQSFSDKIKYFTELHSNSSNNEYKSLPVLVYYSCNRSDLKINLSTPPMAIDLSNKYRIYDQALLPVTKFDDFFQWFRDREDRENAEKLRLYDSGNTTRKYSDSYLDAVRSAIKEFFPELAEIKILRNTNQMVVSKNGIEIDIASLSDSEKSLIVLFGDIARRLALANPQLKQPLEGSGIVLIDEIELHLHPEWQRRIIFALTKIFPNCQFIVTTHSPQILGEIEPENIRLLDNFKVNIPQQSYGLDSNSILINLQGSQAVNKEVNAELEIIGKLTDEKRFEEAKQCLEKLRKKLHGSTTDTLCMETAINVLES